MKNLPYTSYNYIFPPRAEHKADISNIGLYDNGTYIAQPKYNGSCCMVFMDETSIKVTNRHREDITLIKMDEIDFRSAYKGTGYMVLAGELLNKNKKGEDGQPFNQKFIIWDIIVFDGIHLVGHETQERLNLLEKLFPCSRMQVDGKNNIEIYSHVCTTGIKGIYKAPTYIGDFETLYNDLVKVDLYEGLVLKRANATLQLGFSEKNNASYQIKFRKETKNYKF